MAPVQDITKDEAAAAIRSAAFLVTDPEASDYGRVLIHTFRGAFGADWDVDAAVHAVSKARSCHWASDLLGHDLAVIDEDGRVTRFGVKRPSREADQ